MLVTTKSYTRIFSRNEYEQNKKTLLNVFFIAVSFSWIVLRDQAGSQRDLVDCGTYLVETVGACGYRYIPRIGAEPDYTHHLSGHPSDTPLPQYDNSLSQSGVFFIVTVHQ